MVISSDTSDQLSIIDLILMPKEVFFSISYLSNSPVETLYKLKSLTKLSPWVPFPEPGKPNNKIFT